MANYVIIKHSHPLTEIVAATDDYSLAQKLAEKFKDIHSQIEIKPLCDAEFYMTPVWCLWFDGSLPLRCDRLPDHNRGVYDIVGKVYITNMGKTCVHVAANSKEEAIESARKICDEYLKQKNSPEAD